VETVENFGFQFLKTEPTINFENRKLGSVFKKPNRWFLDGF